MRYSSPSLGFRRLMRRCRPSEGVDAAPVHAGDHGASSHCSGYGGGLGALRVQCLLHARPRPRYAVEAEPTSWMALVTARVRSPALGSACRTSGGRWRHSPTAIGVAIPRRPTSTVTSSRPTAVEVELADVLGLEWLDL